MVTYRTQTGVCLHHREQQVAYKATIGPAELRCDDSQFAMVSNELMDKLYECGAYEMFYTGMLD